MKVAMYPSRLRQNENPYFCVLVPRLKGQQIDLFEFNIFSILVRRPDIIHIHWPERIIKGKFTRRFAALAYIHAWIMISAIKYLRKGGAKIVWTAHNLKPHDLPSPAHKLAWDYLELNFFSLIDGVVIFFPNAETQVKSRYPILSAARFALIPHHNYIEHFASLSSNRRIREEFRIPPDSRFLFSFGLLREYKNLVNLVKVFSRLDMKYVLIIAGKGDLLVEDEIRRTISSSQSNNINFVNQELTDHELADFIREADFCIFNFSDSFNSGSVLTSLSLATPVIAPCKGATEYIRSQVGEQAYRSFANDITPQDLLRLVESAPIKAIPCDSLEYCSPDVVAVLHRSFYNSLLVKTNGT